jgi:hypothetical protein
MATGSTKTDKTKKEKVDETTTMDVVKLKSDLKDLKDLYDNETALRQKLTKENDELQAKILELKSLLQDNNAEKENEIAEYEEAIENYSKDVAVKEAIITELRTQQKDYFSIIESLIENK